MPTIASFAADRIQRVLAWLGTFTGLIFIGGISMPRWETHTTLTIMKMAGTLSG